MNTIVIQPNTVHIWHACVPDLLGQALLEKLPQFSDVLDADEWQRAQRFKFDLHRQRFIVARGVLRHILSLYTGISPEKIQFTLGPKKKPYLQDNPLKLQFNVSHSHDMAIYGITVEHEIGVDIEKIEQKFNEEVAKRFFNSDEYASLMKLKESERPVAFYRLWALKEAVIKALGEGLYTSLSSFCIDLHKTEQQVVIQHQGKTYTFHLKNLFLHDSYQAAFATTANVKSCKIITCTF